MGGRIKQQRPCRTSGRARAGTPPGFKLHPDGSKPNSAARHPLFRSRHPVLQPHPILQPVGLGPCRCLAPLCPPAALPASSQQAGALGSLCIPPARHLHPMCQLAVRIRGSFPCTRQGQQPDMHPRSACEALWGVCTHSMHPLPTPILPRRVAATRHAVSRLMSRPDQASCDCSPGPPALGASPVVGVAALRPSAPMRDGQDDHAKLQPSQACPPGTTAR
jgi:hypothetical protein